MKRILLFIASLLLTLNSFAQQNRNLVIRSGTGDAIQVYVNETLVNEHPLKELRIRGLSDNYYDVKVVFVNQPRKKMFASVYVPPLSEIVYEVYAPDRHKPRGDFLIKEIYPIDNQLPYYQSNSVFSWAVNNSDNMQNETVQPSGQINNNNANNDMGSNKQVDFVSGYQGKVGCVQPVNTDKFENMLKVIKTESFESSKLRVAKKIIKNNSCMTVNQLVQILGIFNFDDSRLDLAKFAFNHIYDLDNYAKVFNVFDFDDNKKKLENYIKNIKID